MLVGDDILDINNIKNVLLECYSKDLCYSKLRDSWNVANKCLGMCAITSLIINDYFGGSICKVYVAGISHYFNMIDGKIVDLTSSQFEHDIDYRGYQVVCREDMLNDDTEFRYNLLKIRVANRLLRHI